MLFSQTTENQKEMISFPFKRVYLTEAGFFALIMFLGVASGYKIIKLFEIHSFLPQPLSIREFLVYVFGVTFFFVALAFLEKKKIKNLAFKLIFLVTVFVGNLIFFTLWIHPFLAFFIVGFLTILWLKAPFFLLHDLYLMGAMVGVGARMGVVMAPESVILLLGIFSLYDWLGVYKTKHIVKIAQEMLAGKSILGIIVPFEFSQFLNKLPSYEKEKKFIILGAGDLVFPLILAVSLLSQSVKSSVIVGLFSFLGFSLSFFLFASQKTPRPFPALPPIAISSIIGYLTTLII